MPKKSFTQEQQLDLTERLQLLLLDALAATGSWEMPRFQGGTCLSLTYGSPRYSEDLDFILGTDRGLNRMVNAVRARLTNTLRLLLPGAEVRFKARDEDMETETATASPKNPRMFMMTVSHPDWYRNVAIKVEFWVANPEAVAQYESRVAPARIIGEAIKGVPLRATLAPVMLQTATLNEILVDKLHAIAGRDYLKLRDVFDLWWLSTQQGLDNWLGELQKRYPYHATMYANSPGLASLYKVFKDRGEEIHRLAGSSEAMSELRRWLGSTHALATQASFDAIVTDVGSRLMGLAAQLQQQFVIESIDKAVPGAGSAPAAEAAPKPRRKPRMG